MSTISDFKRINKIGQGAFGTAWLVESKIDSKKYVIKEIGLFKMHEKERYEAKKEVSMLSKMNHPNIVTYYNSFEESGCFHILMEYCEGGDLYRKLKSQNGVLLKEDQILEYFIQICLALKHIHDQKILHRDIKPQNIFLTKNNNIKLGDFGIAKAMDSTTALTKTTVGTPFYFSPEICEGCPYNNKSDIWSLGCILYELCSLNYAFYGQDITILAMRIKKVNYKPIPGVYSAPLRSLIDNMFRRRPDERPNINAILRKPFIMRKLEKILPPENQLFTEANKPVQKRPSTANVASRIDSGLSNKKKTKITKDNLIANSPYMAIPNRNIHDKRVSPRIVKQDVNPLLAKQQEFNNKYKVDMINLDRENGWKNILSSDDSKSESKESKLNNKVNLHGGHQPPAVKQKINAPAYDRYYAELDRIKEQQYLREKEGKALMQQMYKQNENKSAIKMHNGADGIYRKIDMLKQNEDRNKINDFCNLHGKLGGIAGDQAVIQEFLERKRQAKNMKYRDGSAMACIMGGQNMHGELLPIPRQTPRNVEEDIAERLNKIRQRNFEQRKDHIFDDQFKRFELEDNENIMKYNQIESREAMEKLKNALKQRCDDLKQKLEMKEKEREKIKENKMPFENEEYNNAILFPKRNTPVVANVPLVKPSINEQNSISVIIEKMNENVTPAGDNQKMEINESIDTQPSLSVVLSQLDSKSRPSTASNSDQSEIRKRKDDILKRLNRKPSKISEEVEETKQQEPSQRKSWIFDMDENNICKKNTLENTISDCETLVDVSFLHHDDNEKERSKWKIDEDFVSHTIALKNIKEGHDPDSLKFDNSTVVLDQPSVNIDLPMISENLDNTTLSDAKSNLSTIIEVSQEITEIKLINEYKSKSKLIEREEVWNENKNSNDMKKCEKVLEIKNETNKEKETRETIPNESMCIQNINVDNDDDDDNLNQSDDSQSDEEEDLLECLQNALSINFLNSSSKSIDNENNKTPITEMLDDQIKITNCNSLQDLTKNFDVKLRRVKSDGEFSLKWDKDWSSEDTDAFSSEDFGDEDVLQPENIFLKIEKIRIELERKIGIDLFIDAIEFVRDNQDLNGDQLAEKLKELIGDEESINEILQLVVLEEQYNHNIE